jgi:hypothetical protein
MAVFCFLVGRVVVYCCGHANRFFILVCVIWVFNGCGSLRWSVLVVFLGGFRCCGGGGW